MTGVPETKVVIWKDKRYYLAGRTITGKFSKAQWTADSRFFICSVDRSPIPTQPSFEVEVFSRDAPLTTVGNFARLNDLLPAIGFFSDFELAAPHTIRIMIGDKPLDDKGRMTTADLDSLFDSSKVSLYEFIRDAQITLGQAPGVQLVNGRYQTSNSARPNDIVDVGMCSNIAIGALSGLERAAALLCENFGGSGIFLELHVFQRGTGDNFIDEAYVGLGDRVNTGTIQITNDRVVIPAAVHGPNDGLCCPSVQTVQKYQLEGNRLVLVDGIADRK